MPTQGIGVSLLRDLVRGRCIATSEYLTTSQCLRTNCTIKSTRFEVKRTFDRFFKSEFFYQQYFGFLLFGGSRNYPIVNLNSREDSWCQDDSVYTRMPLLDIGTVLCQTGNCRKFSDSSYVFLGERTINQTKEIFPIVPFPCKPTQRR